MRRADIHVGAHINTAWRVCTVQTDTASGANIDTYSRAHVTMFGMFFWGILVLSRCSSLDMNSSNTRWRHRRSPPCARKNLPSLVDVAKFNGSWHTAHCRIESKGVQVK